MASYQYIFSLENLSKTWSGGKTLFENINLSFLPNAKIGIVGINGSGKSTFLKILSGIDKEYNGEIIAAKGIKVGYLPQEPDLDHAKMFMKALMDNVNKYESQNGAIKDLDPGVVPLNFGGPTEEA